MLVTGVNNVTIASSPHLARQYGVDRDTSNYSDVSGTIEDHLARRYSGSEVLVVNCRTLDQVEIYKRCQSQSSGIKHDVFTSVVTKKLRQIRPNLI